MRALYFHGDLLVVSGVGARIGWAPSTELALTVAVQTTPSWAAVAVM